MKKLKQILIKSFTFASIVLTVSSLLVFGMFKLAEVLENIVPVEPIVGVQVARASENMPLSVENQIRQIAKDHNFKWTEYLIRLAYCESKFDQYAIGDQGNSRGIFQINNRWHEVSNEQAFNVRFATEWTMKKIDDGKQGLWSCDRIIKS